MSSKRKKSGRDSGLPNAHAKNIHLDNLTKLSDLLEAEGLGDKLILIVGGPRVSHELAKEHGYDAGFGTKTYAADVVSFTIHNWNQ